MKLIAHRGNITGKVPEKENHPDYILKAIKLGYDVEIDVRLIDDKIFLGHDNPQYEVSFAFLMNSNIWCHAKNPEALQLLYKTNSVHYFWHDTDDYALTSKGYLWMYPCKKILSDCNLIYVLPEKEFEVEKLEENAKDKLKNCYGICSDFVENFKKFLKN